MGRFLYKKTLDRIEKIKELQGKGYRPSEIIKELDISWGIYQRLNELAKRKEKGEEEELTYAPEVKPEAKPVVIRGERYLDVTSFWT